MTYTRKGNFHCISRVTGPAHNFLAIEFGPNGGECVVERLGTQSEPQTLTNSQVKAWVLAGVAGANEEAGTSLSVCRIQYVAGDTPEAHIYKMMAREMVMRAR